MPHTDAIAAALAAKTLPDVAQACLAHYQSELIVATTASNYWSRRRAGQVNLCISDQEHQKETWDNMRRLEKVVRNLEKVLACEPETELNTTSAAHLSPREAFEAWYKSNNTSSNTMRSKKGYIDNTTRVAWRAWQAAQTPAQKPEPAQGPEQTESYTYASKQATNCAGCGEYKHTPLRIDKMGGYICLACIDKKLGSMLGEFGYPAPAQPAQEPVAAKLGMYEHSCPNVTGHRGPSFVCQKAGHGVGQNSYCEKCECPQAREPEQPAQQEPVAWLFTNVQSGDIEASTDPDYKQGEREYWHRSPLHHPQAREWVRLTDEQINDHRLALGYDSEDLPDPWDFKQGVRAAELAHGITGEKK